MRICGAELEDTSWGQNTTIGFHDHCCIRPYQHRHAHQCNVCKEWWDGRAITFTIQAKDLCPKHIGHTVKVEMVQGLEPKGELINFDADHEYVNLTLEGSLGAQVLHGFWLYLTPRSHT